LNGNDSYLRAGARQGDSIMGREIRRVPKGWQHPKDERTGRYIPLFDYDYESKAQEWIAEFQAWESGAETFPDGDPIAPHKEYRKYYWEYANTPDEETCRPKFDAEPTCYQVYETVSEGTPVSPVFETLDAMIVWLVSEGYSQVAAERFAKEGWAMSAAFDTGTGRFASDIETYSMFPPKPDA
jgi:hypothetical protein